MRRFGYLGLQPGALERESFYLHQWHPKLEGVPGGERAPEIRRNLGTSGRNHAILRNDRNWGTAARDTTDYLQPITTRAAVPLKSALFSSAE